MAVAEHLDFDVAGIGDGALQDHGRVAERALRFGPRAAQRIEKRRGVRDQPHAAPAAAGGGLDHHRESRFARPRRNIAPSLWSAP